MADFRRDTPPPSEDAAFQQWLGGRIRAIRTAAGLNQDDFSDVAGIQRSYVGLIENGKKDLRINTLRRSKAAFGLQVHEVLDPNFVLDAVQMQNWATQD